MIGASVASLDREIRTTPASPTVGRRKLLLTVHVLATVGLFGVDLGLLVLGTSSLAGADPLSTYPAAHLMSEVVIQPLAVVSLVTGIALARLSGWGLLRYWWTAIKLAITLALTAVVVLVLVPRLGAAAAAPGGAAAPERLPLVLAPAIASSLLVLNVLLAIYKPRWRLRNSRRGPMGARLHLNWQSEL
jgi:hypothetical protein